MADTKACNLDEDEIKEVLEMHGRLLDVNVEYRVERIKYLYSRLKTFNADEAKPEAAKAAAQQQGWGNNG